MWNALTLEEQSMADVTGPISTLPGAAYAVPEGTMCDDHPRRKATHRVQGETDSFGCEMHDFCDECYREYKRHGVYTPDECDWCKKEAADCRPTRDYDEGLSGPVYYVCWPCRKRRDDRVREEAAYDYGDDDWDDDDWELEPDDYEEQPLAAWQEPDPRLNPWVRAYAPPRQVAMTCKACRQPYAAKHRCPPKSGESR